MAYKGMTRGLSVLWSIDEATSTVHKGELDRIVLEVRQGSQSDDSCPTSGPPRRKRKDQERDAIQSPGPQRRGIVL